MNDQLLLKFPTKKQYLIDDFYVSPRSLNSSFNASITTYYNYQFNSKFYFSNSEYNFAQQESEYYQDQKIDRIGLGFNYRYNNFLCCLPLQL